MPCNAGTAVDTLLAVDMLIVQNIQDDADQH